VLALLSTRHCYIPISIAVVLRVNSVIDIIVHAALVNIIHPFIVVFSTNFINPIHLGNSHIEVLNKQSTDQCFTSCYAIDLICVYYI